MINHSGKVQRRDPSVPWHKTCWRQRYSWHPQTLKRVSLPLKGWVPSSPASALLRMEESITVQQSCLQHGELLAHTQSNRGSLRRQDFSLSANTRCGPRKCPAGFFFFSHVITGTLRFSEKMMLCLVTTGRKAPLEAASLGCPNHIFKGRSLVICSWHPAYHCTHVSGSTSAAKIIDHQFWFYSFLSFYLTSGSLKCNLTPCAVAQEMMTTMRRGSVQILSVYSIPVYACNPLKSTWFVLATFPNDNTEVHVEK